MQMDMLRTTPDIQFSVAHTIHHRPFHAPFVPKANVPCKPWLQPITPSKKHRGFVKQEIYLSLIHCNCHIMTSAKYLIVVWPTLFNIQTSMNLGAYLVPRGSAPRGMEVKPLSKNARNYQEGSTHVYPLQWTC